jgi:hypothetical protein
LLFADRLRPFRAASRHHRHHRSAGGVVQVPGGPALNIVPGALSAETTISVQARTSAPSGALSTRAGYFLYPQAAAAARR